MCEQSVMKILRAVGAKTEIIRTEFNCAAVFAGCIPTGSRAVFLYAESAPQSVCQSILQSLSFCSPVCVRVGEGCIGRLFSLGDDIRSVVALGKDAIAAARFFASVRGILCIALPDSPSAEECFVRCPCREFDNYPVDFPHRIVLNKRWMCNGIATALSDAALSALCAEELRSDTLFTGREYRLTGLEQAAQGAVGACKGGRADCVRLFFASALFCLERQRLPQFACMGFVSFLNRRMPQNESKSAFSVLRFCAQRQVSFYQNAVVRPYYVPDYVGRISEAAEQSGIALERLLQTANIPSADECFERLRIFKESRQKMSVSSELFSNFVREASRGFFAFGDGMLPRFPLQKGYSISAEFTSLVSLPVLERDFGLLQCEQVEEHKTDKAEEQAVYCRKRTVSESDCMRAAV